jgi:ubiquitin-like protein ATG12
MPSPRLPFRTASTDAAPIPDEEDHEADLPLTMTASVVLTSLPRDAHAALAAAGAFEKEKSNTPALFAIFAFYNLVTCGPTPAVENCADIRVSIVTVRFKAVGSAPILQRQICKISATQRFEGVVAYLRRVLKCGPTDSVFLYVNSTFAPALDEIVGNLHRVSCFQIS